MALDTTYNPSGTGIRRDQGGRVLTIGSTGQVDIDSGGRIVGASSDSLVINSSGITIGSTGDISITSGGKITTPVTSGTTTANITNYGLTVITAVAAGGAQVFDISDPVAGVRKTISCLVANSSDTATLKASTAVSFDNGSKNRFRFVAEGCVSLHGASATRWHVTSVSTAVAFPTS